MFAQAAATMGLLHYKQQSQPHNVVFKREGNELANQNSNTKAVGCVRLSAYSMMVHLLGSMSAAGYGVSVLNTASWTAVRLSEKCWKSTLARYTALAAAVALASCFWLAVIAASM